jgi:hypothetical protein
MTTNGQEPGVSVPAADGDKSVATLKAQFALAGHEMRILRNTDGRTLYEVRRWSHARVFSTLHDVQAFLTQVTGGAA